MMALRYRHTYHVGGAGFRVKGEQRPVSVSVLHLSYLRGQAERYTESQHTDRTLFLTV